MDLYVQLEHGEELRSITFKGRVRLHVDFNAIGRVVAVEPIDGAVVIGPRRTSYPRPCEPGSSAAANPRRALPRA